MHKDMPDNQEQLSRSDTALPVDRAASIRFKVMSDGHIRAFQSNTKDLRGVSELQITPPQCVSPTIIVAHTPKLLIVDERIYMALRFPCVLQKQRSEEGKKIRKQYKNDIGVPYQACKVQLPRQDGICPTITTFNTDVQIMEMTDNKTELVYHEHPTKADLLEYFGQRIRIRKMTPKTAMRLMDVEDSDIDKIMNLTETVTLKNGTVKTKKAISKTAAYKLAGNSIVASVLYYIFRTMFIPDQPENSQPIQLSLFDF